MEGVFCPELTCYLSYDLVVDTNISIHLGGTYERTCILLLALTDYDMDRDGVVRQCLMDLAMHL